MPCRLQPRIAWSYLLGWSVFGLFEMCLHDVRTFACRTEYTEGEVGCFSQHQVAVVLWRIQCRSGTVGRIMDAGCRVQTSDFHLLFADEYIVLHEAFEVRNTVLYIHDVEAFKLICHTILEAVPILAVVGTPTQFGNGQHTWSSHVMHTFASRNPFAPNVALYPLYEVLLTSVRHFLHRFVIVDVAD